MVRILSVHWFVRQATNPLMVSHIRRRPVSVVYNVQKKHDREPGVVGTIFLSGCGTAGLILNSG